MELKKNTTPKGEDWRTKTGGKPAKPKNREISPSRIILLSFAGAILLGSLLLSLPISATKKPLAPEDALFTATSAVCVTGLIVVDTEKDLSFFGQLVVMILIQLGGLGIMTFSTFFVLMFRRGYMSQSNVILLRDTLTPGSPDLRKLLFAVFKVTVMFELWGMLLLYIIWRNIIPPERVWWDCMFHSVSAFCNAGFSTFSENIYRYRQIHAGCLVIMVLIILGGFGFCVLDSLLYRKEYLKLGRRTLPLQTKVVLATSGVLILSGTLFFWAVDGSHSLVKDDFFTGGFHALFQSVTSRTAGFNTVDFAKLSHLGLVLLMGLMFIGGSPGSTAGGIKTTTAAILFATIRSHLKSPGKPDVEIFRRRIPPENVSRAFIILVLSLLAVLIVAVSLFITERNRINTWPPGQEPVLRIFFETISAFGTVGLSTGITPFLSWIGKLIITLTMFVGRLGPLTVVLALVEMKQPTQYRYPEEKIMVG
jgi:trk system potassium uptake protein TrkH